MNRKEIVLYALGIALVFISTLFLKIPNAIDGYFHLGDGFILLFSSIASPIGGFMIGGVGSALADLAGGYPHYIIYTLIIKGLEGVIISSLFKHFGSQSRYFAYSIASIVMIGGYFLAKWQLKGSIAIALAGIPENIIQAGVGFVIAILLLPRIQKLSKKYFSL